MDTRYLSAALASGITLFILGYLFYGALLMDFFEANTGSATGVWKDPPDILYIALGELISGALIALAVGTWAGADDFMKGLKLGAVFGLLFGLSYSLTMYGASNISNLTASTVDVVVSVIRAGLAGGVVGLVMGKMSGSGPS